MTTHSGAVDMSGVDVLRSPGAGLLGVAVAGAGLRLRTHAAVAWVVVEGGEGDLAVDGTAYRVGGRDTVFDGPGWSAFVGPNSEVAADTALRCVVAWRAWAGAATSRIIEPSDVATEERGHGAFVRTVRTYLPIGPIIAGETVNPPGGWSSYPPHRHEHEEAYVYRFDPATGFGLAARYDDATSDSAVVRDGDLTWIPSGYHPVVAAPGYAMTYIWALAGAADELTPELDPTHAWVQ